MLLDPRRILLDAAQERAACELLPRGGGLVRATVVRVERGGVVVTAPQRRFTGGEDLRVWLSMRGRAWTFEASVLRAGVNVPDRSQDGLLLGFLDRFVEARVESGGGGRCVELVPPSGAAISLLHPPARLLHLDSRGASFSLPHDYKLVFVESGRVRVRLGAPGRPVSTAEARVRALSPGEDYLLYDLDFEEIDDPQAHRVVVEALSATLDG